MSDRYPTYPRTADQLGQVPNLGVLPNLGRVDSLGRLDNLGLYFSPLSLFANGEQGGWWDPSDLTVEMVAWRRNLLLNSEFDGAVAGSPGTVPTAWTQDAVSGQIGVSASGVRFIAAGTRRTIRQLFTVAPNEVRVFRCNVNIASAAPGTTFSDFVLPAGAAVTGGTVQYFIDGVLTGDVFTGTGAKVLMARVTANSTGGELQIRLGAGNQGNTTADITFLNAQLTLGPSLTEPYQRITDFNSDFVAAFPTATLYQNAAGTTPVTALGQPVGLVLDKSGRGNHLVQTIDASRPTLQARSNLITNSEFVGAVAGSPGTNPTSWTNTTSTGEIVSAATGALRVSAVAGRRNFSQAFTWAPNEVRVLRCDVNVTTATQVQQFIACIGAAIASNAYYINGALVAGSTLTPTGPCTLAVVITANATGGSTGVQIGVGIQGNGTGDITFLNAQLTYGPSLTEPYQRVTTATDYADIGLPRYLQFDGFDDFLRTPVGADINFTATDEMTVCAGVRKLSDAASQPVAELSAVFSSNAGAFALWAPLTAAPNFSFSTFATTVGVSAVSGSQPAPALRVVTGLNKIASDNIVVRVDGVQSGQSATDQGTGNYGTYPLFIGRRGGTTLPFNGRLNQLIIRNLLTSGSPLLSLERFVGQKTGVTL